ncbi:hypothetical protein EAO76_13455 [Streptomyces sp. sk2.1]|nr:hypothetical protein EAO76_13455 [Streptomyces sp. sk2.1]
MHCVQRRFRLAQARVRTGGALPATVGKAVVRGEGLGQWVTARRDEGGREQSAPAQRLLSGSPGLEPAGKRAAGRPIGPACAGGRRDGPHGS